MSLKIELKDASVADQSILDGGTFKIFGAHRAHVSLDYALS